MNMKKIISLFILIFVTWGLLASDADARRFGGGRSFGMQRSASSFSRPTIAAAAAAPAGNRWLGPLAGLAAGGLLASLFMGNGFANGIMSWILLGGAALLIFNLLKRRNSTISNNNSAFHTPTQSANSFLTAANSSTTNSAYPASFNADDFLRNAKVQFIRLQAASDAKNSSDIRNFTSPEVYAEIQLQFQEDANSVQNHTDVISLNAELVKVDTIQEGVVASVQFSGLIREEVNGPSISFKEIWHFQKNNATQVWLLVGLQQS